MQEVTFTLEIPQLASLSASLAHTKACPELAWMGPVGERLAAVLSEYKSKAPLNTSISPRPVI